MPTPTLFSTVIAARRRRADGFTQRDFAFRNASWVISDMVSERGGDRGLREGFQAPIEPAVPNAPDAAPLARVMGLYNASTRYGGDWQKAYIDVTTDLHFYCDSRTVLDATSKQGVPAWGYRLDHAPFFMRLDDCLGVPHTSDLFFLFGNFDSLLDPDEVALGRDDALALADGPDAPDAAPAVEIHLEAAEMRVQGRREVVAHNLAEGSLPRRRCLREPSRLHVARKVELDSNPTVEAETVLRLVKRLL